MIGGLASTLVEVQEVDNQYKCLLGDVANTCFGKVFGAFQRLQNVMSWKVREWHWLRATYHPKNGDVLG